MNSSSLKGGFSLKRWAICNWIPPHAIGITSAFILSHSGLSHQPISEVIYSCTSTSEISPIPPPLLAASCPPSKQLHQSTTEAAWLEVSIRGWCTPPSSAEWNRAFCRRVGARLGGSVSVELWKAVGGVEADVTAETGGDQNHASLCAKGSATGFRCRWFLAVRLDHPPVRGWLSFGPL